MKRILMANDMSARSDRALKRAAAMAAQFGAELEVVTVVEEVASHASRHEDLAAEELARQVAALPQPVGCRVTERVLVGHDFEDIIRHAEACDADLVVLGIHRHKTREMFRGTTAERIVRYGRRPVLVVKNPVATPYRRVLVASDFSPSATAAAELAAKLTVGGELFLLHGVHRPFVGFLDRAGQDEHMDQRRDRAKAELARIADHLSRTLGSSAPRLEIVLPEGDAPHVIYSQVADLKPDLLAVGTHGRSGIAHALIGSVAEQMLADCPVDVLAVKAA